MPIWSEILREISSQTPLAYDGVRRKYLLSLFEHTNRNVILYASGWLQKNAVNPASVSIGDEDIHALMEVTNGLQGEHLDLILHSPGGSPEAAEGIVLYLRSRFSHIRVIVPHLAMSAASMIACAADEIIMGRNSFLGPTDPQIMLSTDLGMRSVPAQAILDQFEMGLESCSDTSNLAAWAPMLSQYGPDLLVQCNSALDMAKALVQEWLKMYMFKEREDSDNLAKKIAKWLTNHRDFKSHSRHIPRGELRDHGLLIRNLEDDKNLQDFTLSVFHAATKALDDTPATKIVENHTGRAFIKQQLVQPPTTK